MRGMLKGCRLRFARALATTNSPELKWILWFSVLANYPQLTKQISITLCMPITRDPVVSMWWIFSGMWDGALGEQEQPTRFSNNVGEEWCTQ